MLTRQVFAGLLLVGVQCAQDGHAQGYPAKVVRIVTLEAGGANDFAARLIAQGLTKSLGQQVIVENRGGTIPGEIVAKSPPDGYTLTFVGSSFWLGPLLQYTSYDPIKDFSAISLTNRSPNVLAVHPSVPVKSVKELISLARARPGELNYASGPAGGPPHLAAELFKSMAHVDIVGVPYKGGGPALIAVVAGEVHMIFGSTGTAMPQARTGRLRALAVTSVEPSVLATGLPTLGSAGLPGYESGSTYGMLAPTRTPDMIISRLNSEIIQVINSAEVRDSFLKAGTESVGTSPEFFSTYMRSDITKMAKLIKDIGIKTN